MKNVTIWVGSKKKRKQFCITRKRNAVNLYFVFYLQIKIAIRNSNFPNIHITCNLYKMYDNMKEHFTFNMK